MSLPTDPFLTVEFDAFRIALLIIFFFGLYRIVEREIKPRYFQRKPRVPIKRQKSRGSF